MKRPASDHLRQVEPKSYGKRSWLLLASHVSGLVGAVGCLAAVTLYLASLYVPAVANMLQVSALLVGAISLYASGAVPGFVTSLMVFLAALLLELAPADVVFAGFASSGAWLLLSGIIIGAAAREVGLGELISSWLTGKIRLDFTRAVVVLTGTAVLLGFLVPAVIPRIIMLMPLVMAISAALGYKPGSRGYTGLALSAAAGSFYPPLSILTATVPAVIFAGGVDAIYGEGPSYAEFLLYHFPVTGLVRWLGLIVLIIYFFREEPTPVANTSDTVRSTRAQIRLLAVMLLAVAFWMTDTIHGIPPAAVALAAAIIILVPAAGILDQGALLKRIDLTPFIYVAGIISLGAIVTRSTVDELIGSQLAVLLASNGMGQFAVYFQIAMLSSLVCMALTIPAAPVLLVPLASQLNLADGLGLEATLMTEYLGMTNIFLPYQAPPLIVALSLFEIKIEDQLKIVLSLFFVTTLFILPINFVWWKFIGLL